MAGFDLSVSVTAKQRTLMAAILRYAQQLARNHDCRIKYRWTGKKFYITCDGSLPLLQAITHEFAQRIPPFIQGLKSRSRDEMQMRLLARFLIAYEASLSEFGGHLEDLSARLGATPNSLQFDFGTIAHLQNRANSFQEAFTAHYYGHISTPVIVEEGHTLAQLAMKKVLGKEAKRLSFSGMAERCFVERLISQTEKDDLVALNALRRNSKHRGQGIKPERFNSLIESLVSSLHKLARAVRNIGLTTASTVR